MSHEQVALPLAPGREMQPQAKSIYRPLPRFRTEQRKAPRNLRSPSIIFVQTRRKVDIESQESDCFEPSSFPSLQSLSFAVLEKSLEEDVPKEEPLVQMCRSINLLF